MHEFNQAMHRYTHRMIYPALEKINSFCIMFLQIITLSLAIRHYDGSSTLSILCALAAAYVFTDFINGLVHMYMDNNTNYQSAVGPFISSFHLHHANLRYPDRHPIQVYFAGSGTKFWLLPYLLAVWGIQCYLPLAYSLNVFLVALGILSSVAEVSHYWCHNTNQANILINRLQKYRILLSKKHHAIHHKYDNTHYAFLNGMTDPILNIISRHIYSGYKKQADKHVAAYIKNSQTNHHSKEPQEKDKSMT